MAITSLVIQDPLQIVGNVVTARLTLSLALPDREIVARYSPVFEQGGAFGLPTVDPPDGYDVPEKELPLRDGQIYSYDFTIEDNTEWAALAATDWSNTMVTRITDSLEAARALDASINFGTRTITEI